MERITYTPIEESLYFEVLPNGLTVYILPKPGFQKTYATFSTKYGSIDNHFKVGNQEPVKVPDGIAHFLEHKMFEEPEGDVFNKFASKGASANAFTSFDRTVYLFSCTEEVLDNLETLLNFVQRAHLTDENVEKEKGIIGQEIKMYEDNPDWRSYFGLIDALYQDYPVKIDIAGTIESIAEITKETLYQCYNTFYHPSNMMVFVVGGVNPEEIIAKIRDNQAAKSFEPIGEIERFYPDEGSAVNEKRKVIELPVATPKCLIGFKEKSNGLTGDALLKRELTTQLLLDTLFSSSSPLYQKLYNEGIINDTFSFEYTAERDYGFSVLGGDTPDPDKLITAIQRELDELKKTGGIHKDAFQRSQRKKIGVFLRMMNSPEGIANQFTKFRFKGADFFKVVPTLETITVDDLNDRWSEHFQLEQMAVSIVKPVEEA